VGTDISTENARCKIRTCRGKQPAPQTTAASRHSRRHSHGWNTAGYQSDGGAHYMQVSKWLGHESFVTTLTIYPDDIPEGEGGKAVPLARPIAPVSPDPEPERSNVIAFRRRATGIVLRPRSVPLPAREPQPVYFPAVTGALARLRPHWRPRRYGGAACPSLALPRTARTISIMRLRSA
jgi:hypothetical protein